MQDWGYLKDKELEWEKHVGKESGPARGEGGRQRADVCVAWSHLRNSGPVKLAVCADKQKGLSPEPFTLMVLTSSGIYLEGVPKQDHEWPPLSSPDLVIFHLHRHLPRAPLGRYVCALRNLLTRRVGCLQGSPFPSPLSPVNPTQQDPSAGWNFKGKWQTPVLHLDGKGADTRGQRAQGLRGVWSHLWSQLASGASAQPLGVDDSIASISSLGSFKSLPRLQTQRLASCFHWGAKNGAGGAGPTDTQVSSDFGRCYQACTRAYVFFQFSNDSKQTQIYISIFSGPQFDSDPVWRLRGLLPRMKLVCGLSVALSSPVVVEYF